MIKSIYVHIPFCKTICTYCDFCKMYYKKEWVNTYLDSLEKEINSYYKDEIVNTLYIGGGTPNSLNIKELEKLLMILSKIKLNKMYEYTIECNIELLTEEQVILFKKYGINRVSVGVQTLNDKYIKYLGRNHTKEIVRNNINLLKKYKLYNINVDLIYAIPGESLTELENDIDFILELDIPHISTYSLIIEPNTILNNRRVKNIEEDLDSDMYILIIKKLNKYNHYETSNFALPGYESKHNLNYWDNGNYYGFGLGASGYIDNKRYDNTKNLNKYLGGNYISNKNILSKNETIENEFILGFRKFAGINKNVFKRKYDIDIEKVPIVKKLIKENRIISDDGFIRINEDYAYIANEILIEFLGVNYEE